MLLAKFGPNLPKPPNVRITMTRLGPKKLDTDNLAGGMKHVQDAIAACIGVDDGDPGYDWQYRQEQSKQYAVRISIERGE